MANAKPLFAVVTAYDNADDAKADYDAVQQLHRQGLIGTYDAALITKDADGKVHIRAREKPTEHGVEAGLVAGAIVGLFFPPFLLVDAAVGALAGGILQHVRKGLPHGDLKQLGQALDDGAAAVVVVGESTLEQALRKAVKRATKMVEKQVTADADQFNRDLEAASRAAMQGA